MSTYSSGEKTVAGAALFGSLVSGFTAVNEFLNGNMHGAAITGFTSALMAAGGAIYLYGAGGEEIEDEWDIYQ